MSVTTGLVFFSPGVSLGLSFDFVFFPFINSFVLSWDKSTVSRLALGSLLLLFTGLLNASRLFSPDSVLDFGADGLALTSASATLL